MTDLPPLLAAASTDAWGDLAQDAVKIALAIVVGGVIGAEREYREKAAGFRTMILIATGSALFTMLSPRIGTDAGHQARIAAAIVTGIGFLGAGAILRQGEHVLGLTTATSVWIAAALGMAVGAGQFGLALATTGAVVIVLGVFPWFEHALTASRQTRLLRIRTDRSDGRDTAIRRHLDEAGVRTLSLRRGCEGDELTFEIKLTAMERQHEALVDRLLADPSVRSIR